MLTLPSVQLVLEQAARGGVNLPQTVRDEFVEACATAIDKQFSRRGEPTIRMSGLGRPLCQQQMQLSGKEEVMDYSTFMKFIFGDLIEAVAIMSLRLSGANIIDIQKPVELNLGEDIIIKGTLDLIMDDGTGPKVWDIKSASDFAFNHKFGSFGGYEKIKADDAFGYIMQGYLYATAVDLPFGGWIVVNKNSGEWTICEVPEDQEADRKAYMKDALSRAKYLLSNHEFTRGFKDEREMHKGKPTGNRVMCTSCSFCGFKNECWPDAVYAPKATSRAQSRPGAWYTKHKVESVV